MINRDAIKKFRREKKRKEHNERIKRAGGERNYHESRLWGSQIKKKEKK